MKDKKAHGIQLLIRAIVRDPDGKIINDTGNKPAKSFVIQFLEFIRHMGTASGNIRGTAINGTEQYLYVAVWACSSHLRLTAPTNSSAYGIVVGTGDTAPTNTDYKLETQLTEGAGAGNITHGAMIVGDAAEVGANVDIEFKRAFTNNTGSLIYVKESGVYTWQVSFAHMLSRDVPGAPWEVPDRCSLTIIYTMRTTV